MRAQLAAEGRRYGRGAIAGLIATTVMTVLMAVGGSLRFGRSFDPLPLLLARHWFRAAEPSTATLLALAMFGHFVYGTFAGVFFAFMARPMTVGRGLAYGFFLWFTMQMTFVPWLGWADFGLSQNFAFAPYMLFVHLAYGGVLGWAGHHSDVMIHARFDEQQRLRVG